MRYRVKALRPGEGVTALTMEAIDATEVTARLQRSGLQVLSVNAERGPWLGARRNHFSLILFTQELIALLEAGIDTKRIYKVEGMADSQNYIKEKPEDPQNRRISIIILKKSIAPVN